MIINSNNALPAQKLQNCAVAAIKLLFLTRLAPFLRLCTRRLGNVKIKNKLLILHFARLAVILHTQKSSTIATHVFFVSNSPLYIYTSGRRTAAHCGNRAVAVAAGAAAGTLCAARRAGSRLSRRGAAAQNPTSARRRVGKK